MGKLNSGIMGTVYGKVGGIVGFNWKGINAIRSYAIPANPQTPDQQAERTKFGFIVQVAKLILPTVIQKYWDPFATQMSGWNLFVQKNRATVTGDSDYQNVVMSSGDLEQETIDSATYDPVTGSVLISWTPSGLGNGEDTDECVFVIIDSANNIAFVNDGAAPRMDGSGVTPIGTGRNASDLHAYLFFKRGSGTELMVSNSDYSAVAAA
jgi:hypothetical protein